MLSGIVIAIAAMSPSPASCPSTKWCWRRSQRCSWRGRRWSWSWDEMRCDVKSWLWCEHWCILSFFTLWSLFDKDLLISLLLCCVIEVIKPMWYELGVRVFYIRSVSPLIVRWEKWQLWSACNAKCNFRFFYCSGFLINLVSNSQKMISLQLLDPLNRTAFLFCADHEYQF